jgi:hypothetical protein
MGSSVKHKKYAEIQEGEATFRLYGMLPTIPEENLTSGQRGEAPAFQHVVLKYSFVEFLLRRHICLRLQDVVIFFGQAL